MVQVWLVTVKGCKQADCRGCDSAERILRGVVKLAGVDLPEHDPGSEGEFHLEDGRTVGIRHMGCDDAEGHDLDPAGAPYLIVDDDIVFRGRGWDEDSMGKAILDALFPSGLAGLRP